MREIKSILKLFEADGFSSERSAIAQVVRVEESSYRREGARMIVFESGVFEGGISGGCLEGDALKRSQIAILKQEPSVVTYDTSKEKEIGVGLGCNGLIEVLISPITPKSPTIEILKKCVSNRGHHVIVTITALNKKINGLAVGKSFYYNADTQVFENCDHDELQNFLQPKAIAALDNGKSQTFDFKGEEIQARVFLEFIPAQYHLAIYGDNYDVYPMIALAKVMDWDVSLVGNIQKLEKEKLQSVNNLYSKDLEERPELDDRTAIILMAHDFNTDSSNLKRVIKSASPYIASLGPRKRFTKMVRALKEDGIGLSLEESNRIYAPCGLEIGANTPEEIATSIFSEILSVFSGNSGGMLRNKEGPIHKRD